MLLNTHVDLQSKQTLLQKPDMSHNEDGDATRNTTASSHVVVLVDVCNHFKSHTSPCTPYNTPTLTQPVPHSCLTVAAGRALRLVGLWPQVDARSLLAWPQVSWAGLVNGQLLGNGCEEFLYVLARLGRRLEEEQAGLAGILFGIGRRDGALVGRLGHQVELVSSKGNDDVFVCLALQFLDPGLCLVQRCLARISI